MPTYEYRCTECEHEFEQFQKITEDAIPDCPMCGGFVKRLITKGGGFILKGDGFYANDYAHGTRGISCGRNSTCCGRDTPCDTKLCDK